LRPGTVVVRTNVEKGQKENRTWMLATVIGMVVCFGGIVFSFQNSNDKSIDRMDQRIERMDRKIEIMEQRIEQFREFMQSQRSHPVIDTPASDRTESSPSAEGGNRRRKPMRRAGAGMPGRGEHKSLRQDCLHFDKMQESTSFLEIERCPP